VEEEQGRRGGRRRGGGGGRRERETGEVERIWAEAMGDTPSASHGIVCNHSRNPPSSTRDGSGPRAARCPRLGLAWLLQEHGPRLGMFSFQKIREFFWTTKVY
jgi:hypothetical protein